MKSKGEAEVSGAYKKKKKIKKKVLHPASNLAGMRIHYTNSGRAHTRAQRERERERERERRREREKSAPHQ
jgi:hypothetical protein